VAEFPKAGLLNRAVAAAIDVIVVAALGSLPNMGFLAGMLYVLVRDGFSGGQSLGKRLAGNRTVVRADGRNAVFRESMVRNIPFAVARVLWAIPLIGWLAAMAVVVFESLLVIGSPRGARLGDELAGTQVVEDA